MCRVSAGITTRQRRLMGRMAILVKVLRQVLYKVVNNPSQLPLRRAFAPLAALWLWRCAKFHEPVIAAQKLACLKHGVRDQQQINLRRQRVAQNVK